MTATDPRPIGIDRVRYHQDQLLSSGDLNDQLAGRDQLRWWHDRALHDAFGVVGGFEAILSPDATSASVEPGLAYDRFGREVVLTTPRVVPLPEGDGPLVLLAQRNGAKPAGHIELRWAPVADTAGRFAIALALLVRDGGKPALERVAAISRPLARPRIGYGSTAGGATDWRMWSLSAIDIGLEVRIDTSSAGFGDLPFLFAWLRGTDSSLPIVFLGVYVEEVTCHDFIARVALLRTQDRSSTILATIRRIGLSIAWVGIER